MCREGLCPLDRTPRALCGLLPQGPASSQLPQPYVSKGGSPFLPGEGRSLQDSGIRKSNGFFRHWATQSHVEQGQWVQITSSSEVGVEAVGPKE